MQPDSDAVGRKADIDQRFGQMAPSGAGLGDNIEGFQEKLETAAREEIREHFLVAAIAKKENIKVTDEDLDEHFEEMAKQFRMPVQKVRAMFNGEEQLDRARLDLLHRKTIARLGKMSPPA